MKTIVEYEIKTIKNITKKIMASKSDCLKFLNEIGTHDLNGNLKYPYKNDNC